MKSQIPARAGLKQFKVDCCVSYLVWDLASRRAAVIDPHMHLIEQYRAALADHGLKTEFAIDTHTHSDHFSATHVFRDQLGARIAGSSRARSKRIQHPLGDGERLAVGAISLQVLELPGHTPDSIGLSGEGLLFSGDALWIGGSGPIDYEGGGPELLWKSLRSLAGNPVILPAHIHVNDANDLLFSTLETEKKREADWAALSEGDFIKLKAETRIVLADPEARARIEFNLSESPAQDVARLDACVGPRHDVDLGFIGIAAINVEKFGNKLKEKQAGTAFIDVREREEFEQVHIPGTRNIPISELPLRLPELAGFRRIYVSDLSGQRSLRAVKTLSYIGLPDVVNVTGGLKAWMQAGLPIFKKD